MAKRSPHVSHRDLWAVAQVHAADYAPWGAASREGADNKFGADCSCGCLFAAWLGPPHASDWLVCGNPDSHRAGLLTFEHQGCPHYRPAEPLRTHRRTRRTV